MRYVIYIPLEDGGNPQDPTNLNRVGLADLRSDCGPDLCQITAGDWQKVAAKAGHQDFPSEPAKTGMLAGWYKGDEHDPPRLDPDRTDKQPEFCRLHWYFSPPAGADCGVLEEGQEPTYPRAAYWLGLDPEHLPGPAELARSKLLPGYQVRLGDERPWQVPSAIAAPRALEIDQYTGYLTEAIVDHRWLKYCQVAASHAQQWFELAEVFPLIAKLYRGIKLTEDESGRLVPYVRADGQRPVKDLSDIDWEKATVLISLDDGYQQIYRALSMNYRVNGFIISRLGLIRSALHSQAILCAAFDQQEILDALKKNFVETRISLPLGWITNSGDETQA